MIVHYPFYLVVQLWWDNIFELFRPTISMLSFITSWSGFEIFINVQTCRQNVVNANPRWNSPFLSFKQNSPKFQPIKTRILMRAKLHNQNIIEMDMCQHSWKQFPQAILFRNILFATMCTHFFIIDMGNKDTCMLHNIRHIIFRTSNTCWMNSPAWTVAWAGGYYLDFWMILLDCF